MFETERHLVDVLANSIDYSSMGLKLNNSNCIQRFAEVNLGYGIADLVIMEYQHCDINRKNLLSKLDINIYLELQRNKKWYTIEEIQNVTRSNLSRIKSSLESLEEEGFIKSNKEGDKYKFFRKYKPAFKTSIAIEAKLKNWKRALMQAYRYNWFSNYSYVVLPKTSINSAKKKLNMFQSLKVGLASIDTNGEIELIYKPKRNKPYNTNMEYLLNENLLNHWLQNAKPSC